MKKKKKWLMGGFLAAALALVGSYVAQATFDETMAVHVNAAEIENTTLAVGTHLIHLSAMTEELYQIAMESAEESGQEKIYYKSELGDGAWFDLTQAGQISDITVEGIPIEDAVINALFFRYHTKADGITYDLAKGSKVSIFDIRDPYGLLLMPELEPLQQQITMLQKKEGKTESDQFNERILRQFYETPVSNEVTKACDQKLSALQIYYEQLAENKEDAERLNIVTDVMGAEDAKRRAEVFRLLESEMLPSLMEWISGSGWQEDRPKEFIVSADLALAAGTSLENVGQSLIEEQGNMLVEGTTIFSKHRFYLANRLMQAAEGNNYTECDSTVDELLSLSSIENGLIVDAESELALLDNQLIDSAGTIYQAALARGTGEAYQEGVRNDSSRALLHQLLQTQRDETNVSRLELQTLLQAKIERMPPKEGKDYVTERINQIDQLKSTIAQDDFAGYAEETLEQHRMWLTGQLASLTKQLGGTEMDALLSEKTALQSQRMDYLDSNDLAGAKRVQTLIDQKDTEIAAEEKRLNAILQADTSTEAEKAMAQNALGSNTVTAAIYETAGNTAADIYAGDTSGVGESLDRLAELYELNPQAAADALKDIYQALTALQLQSEAGTMTAAKTQQGNLAGEETDGSEDGSDGSGDDSDGSGDGSGGSVDGSSGSGDGSGGSEDGSGGSGGGSDGNGDGTKGSEMEVYMEQIAALLAEHMDVTSAVLTEDMIEALLKQRLGTDQTLWSDQDKAAALLAISWYGDFTKNKAVMQLAVSTAHRAYQKNIPYLYQRLRGQILEYAPVDSLAVCIGYRYIFHDSGKQATLQRGTKYYQFKAADRQVLKENGTTEEMAHQAQFQTIIFIEETYLYQTFQCQVEYLSQTDYGIVATAEMIKIAEELYDAMIAKGEGRNG